MLVIVVGVVIVVESLVTVTLVTAVTRLMFSVHLAEDHDALVDDRDAQGQRPGRHVTVEDGDGDTVTVR